MLKTLASAGALSVVLLSTVAGVANADTSVNPPPPTFVDSCGVASDVYIIPNSASISYFAGGIKQKPGSIHKIDAASPSVSIFPVANPGYTATQTTAWSHTYNTGNASTDVGCAQAAPTPSPTAPGAGSTPAPTPTTPSDAKTIGPGTAPTAGNKATQLPYTGVDGPEMIAATVGLTLLGAGSGVAAWKSRRKKK